MITLWLGKLWAKFAGWLAAAGALIAAGAYLFLRGKHDQHVQDVAQAYQRGAETSREVQAASSKAVDRVAQQAAQAQPPDTVKRDDFDTSH